MDAWLHRNITHSQKNSYMSLKLLSVLKISIYTLSNRFLTYLKNLKYKLKSMFNKNLNF